ncbi:MAG: MMPL family transporter [Chitinophagaceae bacterium]
MNTDSMWEITGRFVLKYRLALLFLLMAATAFMGWHASKVELSYEFSRAIPVDNPKYLQYQSFKKQFGEDGNLLVIGIQSDKLFTATLFNDYSILQQDIKRIAGVEDVLSVTTAVNLVKNDSSEKLLAVPLFPGGTLDQPGIDSGARSFHNLPFYVGLLYNPTTRSYVSAIRINKMVLNSAGRNIVVNDITRAGDAFGKKHNIEMHYSGLPLIRTNIAIRIANEMKWFLLGSLMLSAVILLLFFRSISTMLLSLAVVILGVIWSFGTLQLVGYKITLLTALIPPLIVVIGIPNCIYFLNKYHISFLESGDKREALINMVGKMGIVTLFCNISAAIGFAVFALTKSAILQEFGVVAGINIMVIFFISFILIPSVLSYLPPPGKKETRYLNNKLLTTILDKLEIWSINHRKLIYVATAVAVAVAVAGILRLRSEGFIVDDLPKTDRIYTDMKFFEHHFKGVMPLEIVVDTKRKNGLRINPLQTFERIDSLSQFIAAQPEMARPMSVVEGMKFARQAYYDGDSANYGIPNSFDISFLAGYLNTKADTTAANTTMSKLTSSFMDTTRQYARISVSMADVGSKRLPEILKLVEEKARVFFDSSTYRIQFTGTSVTFLEGSAFIINGLKESILYAFILIALCMLYLFRSFRILICSLVPNLIPLIITAGVMGWTGVRLKPSTVLVFSVALGIAIDITIRFLVNFKQEQQGSNKPVKDVVINTIHSTGISIIYTSLVLIAGFVIFCFSGFGGTQSLGWLTSLTLIVATLTNLTLLPALLISMLRSKQEKSS